MGFYTAEGLTTIASRFLGLHWWKMASSRGETLDEAKGIYWKAHAILPGLPLGFRVSHEGSPVPEETHSLGFRLIGGELTFTERDLSPLAWGIGAKEIYP